LKFKDSTIDISANKALNETLARNLNTSLTTLFVLIPIFIFTTGELKYFSLALILGILFGTWSSLFIAVPLLISWQNFKRYHY